MATVQSPVSKWPGDVTLPDYLTFPQYLAWQDCIEQISLVKSDATISDVARSDKMTGVLLPGVCACVTSWNLRGFPAEVTPQTFPATPRVSRIRLIMWLVGEITKLVSEAEDVPNT